MTDGKSTYMGLAVPLFGECVITQTTGATDIMVLEGGDGQSGDFFVARTSTATERFVIQDGGNVVITQGAAADIGLSITRYSTPTTYAEAIYTNGGTLKYAISKNYNPIMANIVTTLPTTGLTKGELVMLFHGDRPILGVCISTAGKGVKMLTFKNGTIGRLTNG